MQIVLSQDEIREADELLTKIENTKRIFRIGRAGVLFKDAPQWKRDGFRAEKAVSKAFALIWNNHLYSDQEFYNKSTRATDVEGLEVRATALSHGCLLLQKDDAKDVRYVLVVAEDNKFSIVGWCFGYEGMKPEYLKDVGYGQPCYYFPQNKLRCVASLRNNIEIEKFTKELIGL